MHPRIAELLSFIDEQRRLLEDAVAEVPPALRGLRPGPDEWSVAEVLDHLALVEGGVARVIGKRVAAARAAGLGEERDTTSVLGMLDGHPLVRLADSSAKRVAPEIVRPRPDADAEAALASLARSREALRAELAAADGLALGEVTAAHAALGELDMYQWVLFVGQHERRHAGQVQAIARRLPAGAPAEERR